MISAKKLIELLQTYPGDAQVSAYEGESIGLNVETSDGRYAWINAYPDDEEDTQNEAVLR